MNINELIYLYFCKDEQSFQLLYDHFFPMIASLMTRNMADMMYMRDEMLEMSKHVLFSCLENSRVDQYNCFSTFYGKCLVNRWKDFYCYETRHDIHFHYDVVSLDTFIREKRYRIDKPHTYAEVIGDGQSLHVNTMIRVEKERLDLMASHYFSYTELHILNLKRAGLNNAQIARIVHLDKEKVRYTLKKLKKWYSMH